MCVAKLIQLHVNQSEVHRYRLKTGANQLSVGLTNAYP